MHFPAMSNNPPLLSLLNVMHFITRVTSVKAILCCLTKLICLFLREVPIGKDASAEHVLNIEFQIFLPLIQCCFNDLTLSAYF